MSNKHLSQEKSSVYCSSLLKANVIQIEGGSFGIINPISAPAESTNCVCKITDLPLQ